MPVGIPVHLALAAAAVAAPFASSLRPPRPSLEAAVEHCAPATGDAAALIARAVSAAGIPADGRALRYAYTDDIVQDYQSDRPYPPYLTLQWGGTFWLDPAARVQRLEERMFGLGTEAVRSFTLLHGPGATYVVRDTGLVPNVGGHALSLRSRPLDAWTTLADWRATAATARVVATCVYREWPRVVLERATPAGTERLFLDPKSGLPVKLDRRDPDALWGDVHAEYVWTNWEVHDGRTAAPWRVPLAAFRMVDGAINITRSVGPSALTLRDSAPRLTLPSDAPAMPVRAPAGPGPDTVRVGPATFLLVTPAYTSAVTLARDTVWVLDATSNETRARRDAAWVARLFPGRHPVAVVVTDLAWPHVSGVRYWVARGAVVYAHPTAEPFLRRVVDRRWTRAPDSLEQARRARPHTAELRFRAVRDRARLAGGALDLHEIAGVGSEGALMAWLPGDRFLWAGDYVQTAAEPSEYADEVIAAARRAGIAPERVAAMHLPLTQWATLPPVQPDSGRRPQSTRLLPGSRDLVLGHLGAERQRWRVLARRASDTSDREIAHTDRGIEVAAQSRDSAVLTFRTVAATTAVDTLRVERATLIPNWERLQFAGTTITLHYAGQRVTGTVQHGDSTPTPFDVTAADPVFAFNELEVLVRSLPFRAGYRAVVPLFSEMDRRVEYDTLTVIGSESPARASGGVWRVRFADPAIVSEYRVDAARRILTTETVPRNGWGRMRAAPEAGAPGAASR